MKHKQQEKDEPKEQDVVVTVKEKKKSLGQIETHLETLLDTKTRKENRIYHFQKLALEINKENKDDNNNNVNRIEMQIFDIDRTRFGIVANSRYSRTKNMNQLVMKTDSIEFP